MLNKAIKFLIENKLISVLLLTLFVGWGVINAPFSWDTGILPTNPVAVDAIPDIGENQQIVFTQWTGRSPQDIEDQTNIYQQIANNYLQLNDYEMAIENQVQVYDLVRIIANGGSEENIENCDETEQTIQALFNLVQIRFMVVQNQVDEANEI